jgi:hypothetical protein
MTKKQVKTTRIQVGATDQWHQLDVRREVTRNTGILHESQVVNLKMWPLVFLNCTSSECHFNYETKTVIYKLTKLKGRKPANLLARYKHLVGATQRLLGEEYAVTIKLDGKKVHHGSSRET